MATKGKYLHFLLLALALPAIIIWPYTQAYPMVQNARSNTCGAGCCCCGKMAMDMDTPVAGCSCRVSRLPKLPNPPDGLDHPDMSRAQSPQSGDIEYTELILPAIPDHRPANDRPLDVSNSPPLYILNSVYLI